MLTAEITNLTSELGLVVSLSIPFEDASTKGNHGTASMAYTSALLALQFYVFIFTITKTWYHVLESRRLGLSGVAFIILRDGMYGTHESFYRSLLMEWS